MEKKNLSLEEAKEYLLLDKHKLDEACENQVILYSEIAENCAIANSMRDALKEQISVIDAEISCNFRKESTEKLTEARLGQMVSTSSAHKEVYERYIDVKLEADKWSALKESFSQRASMIKELCSLYTCSYYMDMGKKPDNKISERGSYNRAQESIRENFKSKDIKNG